MSKPNSRALVRAIAIREHPRYSKIFPTMNDATYEGLKTSIRGNGLYYPIVVNPEHYILDGHSRYRACRELGLEPRSETRRFTDVLEEEQFVIVTNLRRRHLPILEQIECGRLLLPIEKELAKKRQAAHANTAPGRSKTLPPNLGEVKHEPKHDTESTVKIAKELGIGHTTFEKGLYVLERAPQKIEEERAKPPEERKSIDKLYREVRGAEPPKEMGVNEGVHHDIATFECPIHKKQYTVKCSGDKLRPKHWVE